MGGPSCLGNVFDHSKKSTGICSSGPIVLLEIAFTQMATWRRWAELAPLELAPLEAPQRLEHAPLGGHPFAFAPVRDRTPKERTLRCHRVIKYSAK